MRAARTVIAPADHTLLGADANHRIGRIGEVAEVITDDGSLPAERLSLDAAGVEVVVANEEEFSVPELAIATRPAPWRGKNGQGLFWEEVQ